MNMMHDWDSLRTWDFAAIESQRDVVHLMQFTGLTDKNGREIYEGDIRRGTYNFQTETITSYQVMKWDERYTCFRWDGPEIPDFVRVEVVGNVWEDKDLLI